MSVEAFSFTPSPVAEVLVYSGSATVDRKTYPISVKKRRLAGIHESTTVRIAKCPPDMELEEVARLEDELTKYTENNDVW